MWLRLLEIGSDDDDVFEPRVEWFDTRVLCTGVAVLPTVATGAGGELWMLKCELLGCVPNVASVEGWASSDDSGGESVGSLMSAFCGRGAVMAGPSSS